MNYYSIRGNRHKHPWISPILCWIGRHDYEACKTPPPKPLSRIEEARYHAIRMYDKLISGHEVMESREVYTLQCFYCGHRNYSVIPK